MSFIQYLEERLIKEQMIEENINLEEGKIFMASIITALLGNALTVAKLFPKDMPLVGGFVIVGVVFIAELILFRISTSIDSPSDTLANMYYDILDFFKNIFKKIIFIGKNKSVKEGVSDNIAELFKKIYVKVKEFFEKPQFEKYKPIIDKYTKIAKEALENENYDIIKNLISKIKEDVSKYEKLEAEYE